MEDLVEADFVQPAFLGTGIAPFRTLSTIDTVVPWQESHLMDGEDPQLDDSPGLARWWRAAEEKWEAHKGTSSKLTLRDRLNFHRGIDKQYPRASQRVLYTKSGNQIAACRLDTSLALIDHSLYWAAVASEEEAHFLVAIFNSGPLHELVEPLMSEGLFGKRHIDKYVFQAPIPIFDPKVALHAELASLGRRAESLAAAIELDQAWSFKKVRRTIRTGLGDHGISQEIDQAVAELFGIQLSTHAQSAPALSTDLLGALSAAERKAGRVVGKPGRKQAKKPAPVSTMGKAKKAAGSRRRTRS